MIIPRSHLPKVVLFIFICIVSNIEPLLIRKDHVENNKKDFSSKIIHSPFRKLSKNLKESKITVTDMAKPQIRKIINDIDNIEKNRINSFKNPKPRYLKQRKLRNILTYNCPKEPKGLNDIMTLSLVVLFIYLMFNSENGAIAIFGLPIFISLFGKLFIYNRRLTKIDPRCKALRKLSSGLSINLFEKTKLKVARFLKKHHYNKKRKLSQNGLLNIAKKYFSENGGFNNKGWLQNLKMVTQIVFQKENMINKILGFVNP